MFVPSYALILPKRFMLGKCTQKPINAKAMAIAENPKPRTGKSRMPISGDCQTK
ncbi:MAG: hypothetical protein DDT30_01584 [Dehalococcoidia bacterium]|nr:hypothetical protein [Bacillota bacterium]MBT9143146.1 hypothetical protein [Bacillota bacterium]